MCEFCLWRWWCVLSASRNVKQQHVVFMIVGKCNEVYSEILADVLYKYVTWSTIPRHQQGDWLDLALNPQSISITLPDDSYHTDLLTVSLVPSFFIPPILNNVLHKDPQLYNICSYVIYNSNPTTLYAESAVEQLWNTYFTKSSLGPTCEEYLRNIPNLQMLGHCSGPQVEILKTH